MALVLSNAYLCVRDIEQGQRLDPEGVDYNVNAGAPDLPNGWVSIEHSNGWYTLTRSSDDLTIAAQRLNSSGTTGLWGLWGPTAFLESVAAVDVNQCMPAREAWDRRSELAIRTWLRRIRVWRIDGQVRVFDINGDPVALPVTNTRVTLIPEGSQVPDPTIVPFPWLLDVNGDITVVQADAVVRVTNIYRPALLSTLAGFSLDQVLEDEPAR